MVKKHTNGKGDKDRVTDYKKYSKNWEKIFGKKKKDKNEKSD
tara:strand:- start:1724 stop:1849 length:126 start_codon:yes stop_codon:yes gene_type:complete